MWIFSAVSNSCSAAFTVPKSCKVKLAHINAFHSYFLGPETATCCQGCNSQSVLCRSHAAGRDMTHHVPQQWASIGCCSSRRGFRKNRPILQQHVATRWGLALVWLTWGFHHIKGTWYKLSEREGKSQSSRKCQRTNRGAGLSKGDPCTSRDNCEWCLK